jgi:hypothetical protein
MTPIRMFTAFALGPLLLMSAANGQAPAPAPSAAPPAAQPATDPNTQFVDEILRTATAVHSLIKTMNLEKAFGPQSLYPPGDPRSLQRTADFIGVGAGVGMALGEMAHSQKGALLGAAAGSAGGLMVDQLLRHQAAKMQSSSPGANPMDSPSPGLRNRSDATPEPRR